MKKEKLSEFRINRAGSLQGHYVIARNKYQAVHAFQQANDISPAEKLEVHLWKTQEQGHHYPNKLSEYAKKRMKVIGSDLHSRKKLKRMV